MQSMQLTSDIQKDQQDGFQIVFPNESEGWIIVNDNQYKKESKNTGRKWIGRIGLILAFLFLAALIFQILPSIEKEDSISRQTNPQPIKPQNQQKTFVLSNNREQSQAHKVTDNLPPKQQEITEISQVESSNKGVDNTATPVVKSEPASKAKEATAAVDNKKGNTAPPTDGKFPRVLWVQTDHELEIKAMEIALPAYNQIHFGKQGGFEVRVVNNINAYDWLSDEMIAFVKETHQKSTVELPVYDLLRLALLYEHGGVFMRQSILLMEGLAWVENFMRGGAVEGAALSCKRAGTEILLFHESRPNGLWYRDDFVAAKPKARLIKIILDRTADIAKKGVWPYSNFPITGTNHETQVNYFPWMTETLINVFHRQDTNICQKYGVQSFHGNDGVFMATIPDNIISSQIKLSQSAFQDKYGKKHLLKLNMESITNDIVHIIKTGDLSVGDGNSLLKNKLMMAEGNKLLTTPSKKTRDVKFCIVSLAPMQVEKYELEMKEQLSHLTKQTFKKWNLVNFIQGLSTVSKTISEQVVLANASIYEGLNLQRAATKYCDPASIMMLLDYDETFSSEADLQKLANHFNAIGVFAAFVNLKTVKQVYSPSSSVRGDVTRSVNSPNKDVISDIGNLMRAFTVQAYRFIASFDLYHSSTGRYFDREHPLLAVLELSEKFYPCENGNIVYQVRRFEELMAIPRQRVFTDVTINSNRFKVADLGRFEYFAKFRQHDICDAIKFCLRNYAQVEKLVVLNNGREELGLESRKGKPDLVPRKIHQIWVKGDMPNFKKYLMQRAREANPGYQYFLWGHENFTREGFPESYDLMQTLIEFDKKSPYSKMAMVADIARNEIVYRHGGFYLDTNYMLYGDRPLDKFVSYSLVSAGEVSPKQRVFKNQAFFSCSQFCPRLGRIISHRALASRNQFSKDAVMETGPAYFGKIQLGEEEQDEDTFQPSFEEFYPNFIYDFPNINYNKCIAAPNTPDDQIMFRSPYRAYLKNCPQIYNYALGMDFWDEGFSWTRRRW